MSNSKYKWDKYLGGMVMLYQTGMSIPDIQKSIQDPDNGFTPCLSIVYTKLRSANCPTGPERNKHHTSTNVVRQSSEIPPERASRPIQPEDLSSPSNGIPTANTPAVTNWQTENPIPPIQKLESATSKYDWQPTPTDLNPSLSGFESGPDYSWNPTQQSHMILDASAASAPAEDVSCPCIPTTAVFDVHRHIPVPWEFENLDLPPQIQSQIQQPEFDCISSPQPQLQSNVAAVELRADSSTPADTYSLTPETVVTRGTTRSRLPKQQDVPMGSRGTVLTPDRSSFGSVNGFRGPKASWMGCRVGSWLTKAPALKQNPSLKTTSSTQKWVLTSGRDSGYISGRSTPMSTLLEVDVAHPDSLSEFRGMFRVPCRLHEPQPYNKMYQPQPKNRFLNQSTCAYCLYSGIHNLSWSARLLKFEVFKLEVGLDTLYDLHALDIAGNSALHFAAAGGAGFEHFLALMEAGINPYQINTAGQLFLHCLRPTRVLGPTATDGDPVSLFNVDLVNTLNHLDSKGASAALRWRDNEGRTILDALAPLVKDNEMKTLLQDVGYYLDVPAEIANSPRVDAQSHQYLPSPVTDGDSFATPGFGSDFATTQEKQRRARETYRQALDKPLYVDLNSGDNVLHALSRIRLSGPSSLLDKVQEFVLKNVDLNFQNSNGDTPLVAFIRERPFSGVETDETGATMSKYLDAILWKDPGKTIPNKVNVNIHNREGATALHYAATLARPDSVRSLIEAGANVNARLRQSGKRGGNGISVLQAARNAKAMAVAEHNKHKTLLFDEVLSYLEHQNAVADPTVAEERKLGPLSMTRMPV